MTALEKKAIDVIVAMCCPYVNGPAYDANFDRVSDGDDPKMLDDPMFKKGFENAKRHFVERLGFLKVATPNELKRYAKNHL